MAALSLILSMFCLLGTMATSYRLGKEGFSAWRFLLVWINAIGSWLWFDHFLRAMEWV